MNTQANSSEKKFIVTVIILSVLVFILLFTITYKALADIDIIRAAMLQKALLLSDIEKALVLADSISNEDIYTASIYSIAEKEQKLHIYSDAALHFQSLNEFRDSPQRYLQCRYLLAMELFDSKEYENAKAIFSSLGDYDNSGEMEAQCSYELALTAYDEGDYMKALSMFFALGDFSDAKEMVYQSAYAMTGDSRSAQVIVNSGGMSVEAVEKATQIATLRSDMPIGRLDAGRYHTVYVRDDKTVAACGDNSSGQCEVEGWSDVVQVSAGAEHTVALRSDGTVLACGSNEYEQCNVSGWKNIVQIAASDYDTIGLKSDGSLVSTGYHSIDIAARGQTVKKIFAGSYGAAMLTDKAYFRSTHKSIQADDTQIMFDYLIGTGYTAALYADGTLKSEALNQNVQDIIYADAGPRAIVGVKTDGKVYAHFFRDTDAIDFSSLEDIQMCAVGTEHFVFLSTDGTLAALGDNSYGQCDVAALEDAA